MGIEVIREPKLKEAFEKKLSTITSAFRQQFSDEVTRLIIRTRAGIDKNSQPFPALSPKYAAWKASKGRNPVPDLTFTGSLLASVQGSIKFSNTATSVTGEISVTGSSVYHALGSKSGKTRSVSNAAKARGLIDGGRDFMGFTQEQRARIRTRILEALKQG